MKNEKFTCLEKMLMVVLIACLIGVGVGVSIVTSLNEQLTQKSLAMAMLQKDNTILKVDMVKLKHTYMLSNDTIKAQKPAEGTTMFSEIFIEDGVFCLSYLRYSSYYTEWRNLGIKLKSPEQVDIVCGIYGFDVDWRKMIENNNGGMW